MLHLYYDFSRLYFTMAILLGSYPFRCKAAFEIQAWLRVGECIIQILHAQDEVCRTCQLFSIYTDHWVESRGLESCTA